jgi:hypothetical protein
MGPTPHDEGPSVPISRKTAATSEKVILAQSGSLVMLSVVHSGSREELTGTNG